MIDRKILTTTATTKTFFAIATPLFICSQTLAVWALWVSFFLTYKKLKITAEYSRASEGSQPLRFWSKEKVSLKG